MANKLFSDPVCGIDGIAADYCGIMKNNGKAKDLKILNFVILALVVIFGDILEWFPQIPALFPDAYSYNIANFLVDLAGIVACFFLLGLPGLIAVLELFDTIVIFLLGAYIPALIPLAFWVELFPAFIVGILVYYLLIPLSGKKE